MVKIMENPIKIHDLVGFPFIFGSTPISTQFCSWQVGAHLVLEKLNSRASGPPGKQQIDPYSKLDGEELY